MKKISIILSCYCIIISQYSCRKETPIQSILIDRTHGFIVLNEGSFGTSNASVDYYNESTDSLYSHVFLTTNGIPLGDVAQDIKEINGYYALVVNNSNKIYWLSKDSFKLKFTTENIVLPRYIASINSSEALVTSMNGVIYIINTTSGQLSKTITTHQFTERIVIENNNIWLEYKKMYTSSLPDSQGFLIFDKSTLDFTKRINTDMVPEGSLLLDNKIYSYYTDPSFTNNSELRHIQLSDYSTKTYSNGQIAGAKSLLALYNNSIYYIESGKLYQMDATGSSKVLNASLSMTYPYALGISTKGTIVIGDALNFNQSSKIWMLTQDGAIRKTFNAGIAVSEIY